MLQLLRSANNNNNNSLLANPNFRLNNSNPASSLLSPHVDPRDVAMKNNIKALHDWYDRCARRNQQQVKKALRDRTLYDNKTISWLKRRAPRRARLQLQERDRRKESRLWFESLDFDGSGEISVAELKKPLIAMGFAKSVQEVQDLVDSVDDDGSGEIGFEEFLAVLGGGGGGGGGGKKKDGGKSRGNGNNINGESSQTSRESDAHHGLSTASIGTTSSSMSHGGGGGRGGGGGGGGGGKGGAIKKLHEQLENGELGDTTHMELETLLVSYQRSVLTKALFSRGYKAKNMVEREKVEHQRTVDALYDSYVHDQRVKKEEHEKRKRKEAKRLKKCAKKFKKTGMSPAAVAEAVKAEEAVVAERLKADAINIEEQLHKNKVQEYVPKGGRIKHSSSKKDINKRLLHASAHVHKLGDLRDHYRDELMIERLKEDTHNNSLHAPWTRASQGLNTSVPTKSRLDKMKAMKLANKQQRLQRRKAVPMGRNTELHKLLGDRPSQAESRVPTGIRQLVPIKVSLNSAFLSAKRSKMLQTPSTSFFRTQKRHLRLKTFRDRNVQDGC
jgi:hypothetical protein